MKLTKITFKVPCNIHGEREGEVTIREVEGYLVNKGGFDFVIHKRLDNVKKWTISEYTTGMRVWGTFNLRKDAVAMLDWILERNGERLPEVIARVPKLND